MDDTTREALGHAAKALENLTDVFKKLAGPLAEEVGLSLGDRAREYRLKNAIEIFVRVKRMLAEAGIDPKPIAPRLFFPMIEAGSLEADDLLQERWAALLANASDPHQSVQPSFVEVLKELTPEEVGFLDRIYISVTHVKTGLFPRSRTPLLPAIRREGIHLGSSSQLKLEFVGGDREKFYELRDNEHFLTLLDDILRLGLIRREDPGAAIKKAADKGLLARSRRGVAIAIRGAISSINNAGYWLTPFGYSFLKACHAPTRAGSSDVQDGSAVSR
jgi:hypothetical protein